MTSPQTSKHAIFYFLYRFFAWPLLRAVFTLLGHFNAKIARGLELREPVNGRSPWVKLLPPSPPTVWIHCSSGEFEYAKPVITELKARQPSVKIVVTFFSPTYADAIRKFSGVDWVVPLPWDAPASLKEFLDSYRPFALLVARTDVWPEMARQARERGMKTALFSATIGEHSGRTRGLGRWVARATLSQLDAIFCATVDDARVFESLNLGGPLIEAVGDTRYDQVLARLESPKSIRADVFPGDRNIFVCGSTWWQDEDVLIPALVRLKDRVCGILVPHEPTTEHLFELEEKLESQGLKAVRYSDPEAGEKMREVGCCLVVDQTGILAELYLRARWAFVGGSFRKTVHSVMEPLAAGCLTFVGPLHTNNREALAFKDISLTPDLGFVTVVQSAADLVDKIDEAETLADSKAAIREAIRARTGSSRKLVDWLERQL